MEGWKTADPDTFRCSCGTLLRVCPFFEHMHRAFERQALPFHAPNDFGTGYRLVENTRFNRYLTEALPIVRSTSLERLRDTTIRWLPPFAGRIRRNDRANELFVETALAIARASVFVNADKTPYRLRLLRGIPSFDLRVVHLLREPRGVVLTFMENRGWDAALSMRVWIREQRDILRIMREFDKTLRVYYEDLCDDTDGALARVHRFGGLVPERFGGDFRVVEHHILGNSMRLEQGGTIRKSERWKSKLSAIDLERMRTVVHAFARAHPRDPMMDVLGHYWDV